MLYSISRKRYAMIGIFLAFFALTLPALPYIWLSVSSSDVSASESDEQNPRANFWRAVRAGERGYSAVSGSESGVFIHNNGQNWRQFRTDFLTPYGGYLMGSVLVLIAAYFVIGGPVRLENGVSGKRLVRFSVYQRVVHWFTAGLFLLLALTGLILLFGRLVLIPLLGAQGFAITASACKEAHNLFGPIFLGALILLFINFVHDNYFERGDLDWLTSGAGLLNRHASAGRFNFGEKIWFWLVCLLGLVISISGLVLDFPNLDQGRDMMELSHVVHTAFAILLTSIAFGHIYLGTVGTQGTLRGMTTGYVDANWASQHHDRWVPESEPTADSQQSTTNPSIPNE
jgi:formate dehydrogenase subunit gamma